MIKTIILITKGKNIMRLLIYRATVTILTRGTYMIHTVFRINTERTIKPKSIGKPLTTSAHINVLVVILTVHHL